MKSVKIGVDEHLLKMLEYIIFRFKKMKKEYIKNAASNK